MTTSIDKINLNHYYKADINYSLQLNRWLLKPIGIWPYPKTASKTIHISSFILFLTCIGIVIFSIISCILNIMFEENDPEVKLKTIAPLSYWLLSSIRYCTLLIRSNDIRRCVNRIEIDWQMINKIEERETMLSCVKTGRFIVCFSAAFMHGGIFAFNIFKGVTPEIEIVDNISVSIYRLPYPFYNEILDTSFTLTYRIILLLQFAVTFIVNSVSVGAVGIAAMFVMHACGQLNIMRLWLESLVDDIDETYYSIQQKIGVIVVHHLRVLNLPGKSSLSIALIILRSSRVTTLTAGKIIPLCMETFSNVVQTSFAYLNILLKVVL
ncbi:hypothetical protein M0802_007276 [Mischocyttarus mexicanus]|nr:hypothetical protein M0802_007276 [Mischocyttarus mexicanus]